MRSGNELAWVSSPVFSEDVQKLPHIVYNARIDFLQPTNQASMNESEAVCYARCRRLVEKRSPLGRPGLFPATIEIPKFSAGFGGSEGQKDAEGDEAARTPPRNALSRGPGGPVCCCKPLRILAIKRATPGALQPGVLRELVGRQTRDLSLTSPNATV